MSPNHEMKQSGNIHLRKIMLSLIMWAVETINISHPLPHPSQFYSQKCLWHSAMVFRIHSNGFVVFLKAVMPNHLKRLPLYCGEVSCGSA
jgi:hypothetical protein